MTKIEIVTAKKALRKEIAKLLGTISREQIDEETSVVTGKVVQSKIIDNAKCISFYISTEGEISTNKLIEHCLSAKKLVYVPRFQKGANRIEMLRLSSVDEFRSLEPFFWGIRQHSFDSQVLHLEEDNEAPDGLDVVFMPGVAFTAEGLRLGHGKGFYDNFLHDHNTRFGRMPICIGLALKAQIVNTLPAIDGQDVTLNQVIHA